MIRIAWRNLWRHRGRTWITIAAIALTYGIYLTMSGLQEYMYEDMLDAASKAAGGDVLVQGKGFQDSQFNDILIADGGARLQELRALDEVEYAAPRVIVNGLLSTSASSSPVRLQGVDPSVEVQFQDMRKYIRSGTFLESDEAAPIVLGSEIVIELEAELGDRIILTATGPDGEMQRALFHLVGELHTGSKVTDRGLAYTTVRAAQKALRLPDGALTQIGLLGIGLPDETSAAVKRVLASHDDVEALTWAEAMPDIVGFIEMDRAWGDIFAVILFIVVLFAISNTFLMAVMERVRELGLLRALGLNPAKVGVLVLTETLFLTLVSLVIGLVIGLMGHGALSHWGLDLAALYGVDTMDMGGIALTDMVMYSSIKVERWINISISVVFMVLFSAAYPAYKAGKLVPAQAMRFYE